MADDGTAESPSAGARPRYDLLLKGGTLVDPLQSIHGLMDVAISDGRVADVRDSIAPELAWQVLDVAGRVVTPGLIDLHTHLYQKVTNLGVDVDAVCLPAGVTTSVDAGSAGSITFPGFRDFCVRDTVSRVYAFVNLASTGLIDRAVGELRDMAYADPGGAAATVESNRDLCLGIKVRMGKRHVNGSGLQVLEMTLAAADEARCPVMVHITEPAVSLESIFDVLRPGDIITHAYHGKGETIVSDDRALDALLRARERGVRLDVGHGAGSFTFSTARTALASGLVPDTISTDVHSRIAGPSFALTATMSKFLALGLSLDEVVAATTSTPARTIGKEASIGSLRPGFAADVTVLDVLEGSFVFEDCEGQTLQAGTRLQAALTIAGGRVVAGPDRRIACQT